MNHVHLFVKAAIWCLLLITGCTSQQFLMEIHSVPDGAAVFIDSVIVGTTPVWHPIRYIGRTDQGDEWTDDERETHVLRLRKEGYLDFSFPFRIGDGMSSLPNPIRLKSSLDATVSITGSAQSLSRVTTGGPDEFVCSVSPDGRSLLLEVVERGGMASARHGLQRIDVNIASRVILSPGTSNNLDATWLPDGSSFVFVTDRLGPRTLVQSLGVAGESGVRFITQPSLGEALTPAASPIGKEIAFSISSAERSNQLAIVNLDGSNLRVLGEGQNASWSPDGRRLLFARGVGSLSRLYTVDARTGTDLIELSNGESNDYNPVWSSDGRYMAFTSDRVRSGQHLFIMSSDGRSPTQLTDGRFDVRSPRWAPDGSIYFSANAGGNWDIWRLSVPRK